jgi:hypothetical protein
MEANSGSFQPRRVQVFPIDLSKDLAATKRAIYDSLLLNAILEIAI